MRLLYFSKPVRDPDLSRLISVLQKLEVHGVDLALRPGYPVTPENCRRELVKAVGRLKQEGFSVPLVSIPTDTTRPADCEPIYAACHDAGVPNVKIGYFDYRKGPYAPQLDAARRTVAQLADLSMRLGVRTLIHTHSGSILGLNASAVARITEGLSPMQVGFYLDAGHLSVCGEPFGMACDIAGDALQMVAVKDTRWEFGDGRPRRSRWVPIGEGMVDFGEAVTALRQRNYTGYISVHCEYETPPEKMTEMHRRDVDRMRALLPR